MRSGLPDAAARTLFAGLLASVADEMLEALVRTAFSPNIKERRDASTAVFDGRGRLVAQAARRVLDEGAVPTYQHDPANIASARVADAAGFPDRGWRSAGMP